MQVTFNKTTKLIVLSELKTSTNGMLSSEAVSMLQGSSLGGYLFLQCRPGLKDRRQLMRGRNLRALLVQKCLRGWCGSKTDSTAPGR